MELKTHSKEFACIGFHALSWTVWLVPKVVRSIMAVSNLRLFYDMVVCCLGNGSYGRRISDDWGLSRRLPFSS
ncbi:hypothetical protein KY285_035517 [Solanum tuberosum]|nr:hypothetical protein KY285_035517 [Solanum tuberosum]